MSTEPEAHRGLSRRMLLKRGLFGGALLAAGAVGLALQKTRVAEPQRPLAFFTPEEYSVVAAVADRVIPAMPGWKTPREVQVAEKADAFLATLDAGTGHELKGLIKLFESPIAGLLDFRVRPFTKLSPESQDEVLAAWHDSRIDLRRTGFKALRNLCAAMYYASPEIYGQVGYPGPPQFMAALRDALP